MDSQKSKTEIEIKNHAPSLPKAQEAPSSFQTPDKGRIKSFFHSFFGVIALFLKKTVNFSYPFVRAIINTLAIFLGTIYEIILIYLILVTGNNFEGYYIIPTISIDLSSVLGYPYMKEIGPYTLWVYYALILVAIHAFFVIFLGMYSLIKRDQEGALLRIGRGLTRVYLLWMFLILLQWGYKWIFSIQIRLMSIILIVFFFEIANLKIRSDRKRLGLVIPKTPKLWKKSIRNKKLNQE